MFLGFLDRKGILDRGSEAGTQTTPANVAIYIAELQTHVRAATVHNCIYKLRRASELLAPHLQFGWLLEIQKEIALSIQPISKYDRLVLTNRLLEAGLALIIEAENTVGTPFRRALGVRNGSMIALLGLCPIRRKNFVALELGSTFRLIDDAWWITLPGRSTKNRTPLEQRVPELLKPAIEKYVYQYRPILLCSNAPTEALWVSGKTAQKMHPTYISRLISGVTLQAVGVAVSPHLFRTAAASSAAIFASDQPNLASALLHHRDSRVTQDHYNRASTMSAANLYSELVDELRK